jgi:transglutaminase superfamily protein
MAARNASLRERSETSVAWYSSVAGPIGPSYTDPARPQDRFSAGAPRYAGAMARVTALASCLRHPLATAGGGRHALRALRSVRRDLPHRGFETRAPELPALSLPGVRGGRLALRLARASCLERSLVLQGMLAARGERHTLLIGVARPGSGLEAHAWLAGYDPSRAGASYSVLARVPPP